MDGLEATRNIVSRRRSSGIPKIVVATANVSQTFELKALAAGADGFIPKPFDLAKIEAVLQEMTVCP